MDKSVVIVIVVVVAIVVGLPLAGSLMKTSEPAEDAVDAAPADASTPSASPAPLASPAPAAAAGFDANSLVNTTWAMNVEGVSLNVTFMAGGVLQAQSPMLKALVGTDTVQGRWSASGNNVTVSASAGGKSVSETAVVSGNQLLVRGQPAQRIR